MKTFITSLPVNDNNGRPTASARAAFFARLTLGGCKFSAVENCYGIWFDDAGNCFAEKTIAVTITGPEGAIRRALARFGEDAHQLAVLMVAVTGEHILEMGRGLAEARLLAARHGGATLLPDDTAVSLVYNALEAGVHYTATR